MDGEARIDGQEGQEQDLSGLNDADLSAQIEADSGEEDGTEEATQGLASSVAKEGDEGGEKAKQDAKAPTVEDVSKELAAIKAQLEQRTKERDHWQRVTSRHTEELGNLRQIKQKLQERKAQLDAQDPTQRFIEDPRAYQNELREGLRLDNDLAAIEQREQVLAHQAHREEVQHRSTEYLGRFAPDFRDNMDVVAEILTESGDTPEVVERIRQDPHSVPAPFVATLNGWAKERRRVRELEAKVKELESKPRTMLQKIEQTARHKPLTNASGGGKGKAKASISDDQIASLSDKELAALLQEG